MKVVVDYALPHTIIDTASNPCNCNWHIMLLLPTIWCGFGAPLSSFPGSSSWAQPPSSSYPAGCCCHRKFLTGATEYPQMRRLESECAGGSIPLAVCHYLPSCLGWWGYWGLLSTTLPPQQGWGRPSVAPVQSVLLMSSTEEYQWNQEKKMLELSSF